MVKDTKKNRELIASLIKAYPKLKKYYWELEECSHFTKRCKLRERGKGMCYLCQRNEMDFWLKQCCVGTGCYGYDGTRLEDTEPLFPELLQLIETYPNLFEIMECCDCSGCSGW